jgi:hypothetical protein
MAGGDGNLQFLWSSIPDFLKRETNFGSTFIVVTATSLSTIEMGSLIKMSHGYTCGTLYKRVGGNP